MNLEYHRRERIFEADGDRESLLIALQLRLEASELYGGMDPGHAEWFWKQAEKFNAARGGNGPGVSTEVRKRCADVLYKINSAYFQAMAWNRMSPRCVGRHGLYLEDLEAWTRTQKFAKDTPDDITATTGLVFAIRDARVIWG